MAHAVMSNANLAYVYLFLFIVYRIQWITRAGLAKRTDKQFNINKENQ